jgi:hypothetical protein
MNGVVVMTPVTVLRLMRRAVDAYLLLRYFCGINNLSLEGYLRYYRSQFAVSGKDRTNMAAPQNDRRLIKTSVTLPEESLNSLREISKKTGASMAEVLRKAIATEKFLQDTVAEGGKVLIEERDKTLKQLILNR